MKKRILTVLLAGTMTLGIVGCTTATAGTTSTDAGTTESTETTESTTTGDVAEITFWHSMGGAGAEAIDQFVADFNAANDDIVVTAEYQGEYDDAITKIRANMVSGQVPNVMQLYDLGTRWMIDSGYAIPMQDYIDADGYDASVIEENIAAYYTVDGKLQSMPFNSSTPLMYYNKDLFTASGLDPENPPTNFEELEAAAEAMTNEENGTVGMAMAIYGWYFEQYLAKQGATYFDNGNGRESYPTAVEFDSNGAGLNFIETINDLTLKGFNSNLGRDSESITNSFGSGQIGIIFGSTASLTSNLTVAGDNFELGTAPLPDLGQEGGVSVGGGSLWMLDTASDAEKDATWEFIQYVVSPEVQIDWHKATGYFPVTTESYDLPAMQEHLDANPLFQTAIDQLHASSPEDAGALSGVFTEARQIIEKNWEAMNNGELTPQQVIDESADEINTAVENYNLANYSE